ncbi:MAG TPA: phosphate-starvation-inducible PsiE family protein [Candidatus Methylomirabilis sp.]|nr:phosphate-starvation-inducible PsiE family protein [Candidatus Methylomirabilis sp.]
MGEKRDLEGKAYSTRDRLFRWLALGEDGIYLVAGGLLAATAVVLLVSTAGTFVETIKGGNLRVHAIEILDSLLLVLMLVEILYTIRLAVREHTLLMEPFLIVALIASVRRILVLTPEAAEFIKSEPGAFRNAMVELGLLTLLILVLVVCIAILRRSASRP